MRGKGAHYLGMTHQAGIHTDQLKLVNPALEAALLQCLVQLVQEEVITQGGFERDLPPRPVAVASLHPPGQPIP